MKILEDIINRLDGYDPNKDYFHFNTEEREHIVNVLWEEVYGDYYLMSLMGETEDNPLKIQFDILMYLFGLISQFEKEENYELCDVVNRLIIITENKIQKIEEDYANSKQKSRRK